MNYFTRQLTSTTTDMASTCQCSLDQDQEIICASAQNLLEFIEKYNCGKRTFNDLNVFLPEMYETLPAGCGSENCLVRTAKRNINTTYGCSACGIFPHKLEA